MTRIAYLGPAGTFTEQALWEFGIEGADPVAVESPAAALNAVRRGEAEFAVAAIESSVDGSVTSTSDALIEAPGVQIYGETELDIAFAIMTRPGMALADATTIATHPVAHQQVKQWLAANAPQVAFIPAASNGAGAKMVADGEADAAAAPLRAAELFGLEVHAEGVADLETARTRFLLIGPPGAPPERTGADRTSIAFETPNEPGTLVAVLLEFAYRGVDLSRIESRPTRKQRNTYTFHVDLVGHIDDVPVAEALRSVYLRASAITYLGSWPRAHRGGGVEGKGETSDSRIQEAQRWVQSLREGK
ncbi:MULTISPECIES: prephenate dehydratase [unclassified Corynebacterium]|uniref:prephenate dehydratase n=1 Tax=unclassified Corynebacterium TaxID=2624378 RepID=UPI002A9182F8|nr:prephenate dehydratase [Corynebacterium sp.]MDY5785044.1 prephenate dehydratase [Corynebacterium sp.]